MATHTKCKIWKTFWILGVLSLISAWYSLYSNANFIGMNGAIWFWNALVLTALSFPIKMDCHSCGICHQNN